MIVHFQSSNSAACLGNPLDISAQSCDGAGAIGCKERLTIRGSLFNNNSALSSRDTSLDAYGGAILCDNLGSDVLI
jgi:hypothetical protein